MTTDTAVRRRQRTRCPDCDRDVAFTTDLRYKWLARHKPTDGLRRWCTGRRVEVRA